MVFTIEERRDILDRLIRAARTDPQVIGAALVGSIAKGLDDRWSDIDLALQLAAGANPNDVAERWTGHVRDQQVVADTMDVYGPDTTLYRVFLLASSLQIDLSFWPRQSFRATENGFRLIFGTPAAPTSSGPSVDGLVHLGWLYALHVRSSVVRGRTWQAVMMLDDLRNQVISLASLRHGLPAYHGRGADELPADMLARLEESRARSTSSAELARSARSLLQLYIDEVALHDPAKAETLAPAITVLRQTTYEPIHGAARGW